MNRDWIGGIHDERLGGFNRPLSQAAHTAVNARYPGCTLQYCDTCGEPTGKGEGEPICDECSELREGN